MMEEEFYEVIDPRLSEDFVKQEFVSSYSHSHAAEATNAAAAAAAEAADDNLYMGREFDSFEAADGAVTAYGLKNCVSFYRRHSRTMQACRKRLPEKNFANLNLKYGEITYACIHGGKKFTSHSKGLRPARMGTQQIECPAHIRLKLSPDACNLIIAKMVEDHNHPLLPVSSCRAGEQSVEGRTGSSTARRRGKLSSLSIVAQREIPRVLIDTDAGVADAAAAMMMVLEAHKLGRINVTAITTTYGVTSLKNANRNVLRVLNAMDLLDIPVYSGAHSPLVHPHYTRPLHPRGGDGLSDTNLPHPDGSKIIKKKPAAVRIVEDTLFYQGRLRILSLGPLTNIALAKKMEPKLLCQLASLHVLGGNTLGQGSGDGAGWTACREFNFECDPEAAQIVLSDERDEESQQRLCIGGDGEEEGEEEVATMVQEPCPVYVTPCDTHVHIPISFRRLLGQEQSPQSLLLNACEAGALAHRADTDAWLTHEQLAAAWMLDTLFGDILLPQDDKAIYSPLARDSVECSVTVELQGTHTRGQMVLDRQKKIGYSLPVTILTGVNELAYKRYLAMAFGRKF